MPLLLVCYDVPDDRRRTRMAKALSQLDWVKGPTSVQLPGNSKLAVPEGYVFLDSSNTDRFLELNQKKSEVPS